MITNINLFKVFESYLDSLNKLDEGLIKTHDINKAFDILSKSNFWILNSSKIINNKILLGIGKVLDTENINIIEFTNLLSTITNLGYFISHLTIQTNNLKKTLSWNEFKQMYYTETWFNSFKQIELIIEPKYDIIVEELPNKLYHLTYEIYKDKILKNGLIPKSKNVKSYHVDRIYFSDNIDSVINFYNNKKRYYAFNLDKNKTIKVNSDEFKQLSELDTIIFEIDTKNLDITLYKDPNFKDGYYTSDNINPKYIKIIKN